MIYGALVIVELIASTWRGAVSLAVGEVCSELVDRWSTTARKVFYSTTTTTTSPLQQLSRPQPAIMTLTKINFITGNKNKLIEVRAILGSVIEVDNQAVDVPEIQGTIEEIAKEKARRAAEAVS
ncbi:Ham1-like protein [Penicillium daleae]|uniref:Ham1-like protein n=1 Tax=Penicillium daleae TaxID=63821 RepID=A0AAD6C160_9EURO|nr:Ham1-like protein [Penicillium daleae]KAJ5443611.1 Ham1-like protein [Penicillium daleae]